MNIKEHIEAGHYPKDAKGRAMVPTDGGSVVIIIATDYSAAFPLVGVGIWKWAAHWDADGKLAWGGCGSDLLPPPPRKVRVTRYVQLNLMTRAFSAICLHPSDLPFKHSDGWQMIELSGEYEEPWS